MVRLPHTSAVEQLNMSRSGRGLLLASVVSFFCLNSSSLAQSNRMAQLSGGFGNYYVGVLYRGGKYLDATALAKGLLDGHWITKEAACVRLMYRANLVAQIYRRLGRERTGFMLLAVRVQAVRYWVRGSDIVRASSKVARVAANHRTRVLGWQKTLLQATTPLPLNAALAPEIIPARTIVPIVREAVFKNSEAAKSYNPPVVKTIATAPAIQEPTHKPVARKAKSITRAATAAASRSPASAQRLESWMEKAFVN